MGKPAHRGGPRGRGSRGKAETLAPPVLSRFSEKKKSDFSQVTTRWRCSIAAEKGLRESVAEKALDNRSDSQVKGKTL